ncbi:unnamed protein product [Adineta ricciae]|uniref:Uncharacterized protein n=1 Tax=Adineta ricciae TaxID=249248 RepID=A0A814XX35_ADIRI|nr:unnamed protein product [Adineta ricciae]CAF1649227.1 unnamed protein product [Adineta ricciae]
MQKLVWFHIVLLVSPLFATAYDKPSKSSDQTRMVKSPAVALALAPYVGLAVAPPVYLALAAAFGVATLAYYGITQLSSNSGCPPCPKPRLPRIDYVPPSRPHYPCVGTHKHYYVMHQNPKTCKCYEDESPNVECLE